MCLFCVAALASLVATNRAVFGQQVKAASTTTIPVACIINGVHAGDLSVTLSPDGTLLGVDGPALRALLKDSATSSLLLELAKFTARSKTLSPASLRKAGLSIAFDTQKLELHVTLPPKLQRVTGIRVVENAAPSTAVRVEPAAFSAQLSASGQLDFVDQYITGVGSVPAANSIDTPFSLNLDPAINFRTWVLESDMSLNTSVTPSFSLADLRLVKDFPGPDLRLTAGTLNYATTGFGSAIPIVGVGIGSNFDLGPTKLFRPLGHLGFYLEQPSQVRVLVNGQPVRYLELQPGPYYLSDFPFSPGMNNVELEIQDDQGRLERVTRSFAFAQDLLLPGQSSFSANVGLPGWQFALPVFSGYERVGLTNDLTVGTYVQADLSNQLGGLEGTFATLVGTFHLDLAGSHTTAHAFDMGAYASYRFFDVNRPFVPSVTVSAQYRGRYLLGPESYLSQSPYRWAVRGSVSQGLPKNLGLNLALGYQQLWTGTPSYTATAIFTAPIGKGISLSATAGTGFTPGSPPTWSGGVTIISAGGSTTVTSSNQSLTDPTAEVGASYQPPALPGLTVNGVLSGPPAIPGQPTSASATVNYQGSRFRAAIGHVISDNGLSNPTTITNHSFLRLGSALVYADGIFGIGRPVSDGFAIFVPRSSLRGVPLDINPTQGSYEAQSGPLGGAVLPDITSYTNTLARVDVPQAPMGSDLGNTLFLLSLPYRSGAVVRVGTNATVYADGTVVDESGKPVALVAGSMTPESKKGSAQLFFTDQSGRFQAYNLGPGVYTLALSAGNWAPVTVKIPEGSSGRYEIGNITVRH